MTDFKRVFVDTSPIIYYLENNALYRGRIKEFLRTAWSTARLRGQYRHFKAMDSLQIAAALSGRCDMFLTNDKQLRQEKEMPCMTMEDL